MLTLVFTVIVLAALVQFSGLRFDKTSSFGSTAAALLTAVVAISFVAGYRWQKPVKLGRLKQIKFYMNMILLSVSHAAVTFLLASGASTVASHYAATISVHPLFMSALLAFVLSAGSYSMYSHAAFMSASKLAGLYIFFIGAGAVASMLTSQDITWLQHHFSALGAGDSLSSYAFNFTMIIGGFLMVALSDYIVLDLERIKKNTHVNKTVRMNFLRACFILVGLCSIGVGVFPYDEYLTVHNWFANIMTISFIILVVSIPWTVPMFSRPFIIQSYLIVAIASAVYAQFFIGDLNIFIIELIDAALLFLWMVLFVRQIAAIWSDSVVLPSSNKAQVS